MQPEAPKVPVEPDHEWLSWSQLRLLDQELAALAKRYPDQAAFYRRLFDERNHLADNIDAMEKRVLGSESEAAKLREQLAQARQELAAQEVEKLSLIQELGRLKGAIQAATPAASEKGGQGE